MKLNHIRSAGVAMETHNYKYAWLYSTVLDFLTSEAAAKAPLEALWSVSTGSHLLGAANAFESL